jgi:hypothetical protein
MNRLLSKLRTGARIEPASGNGTSHVRVVGVGRDGGRARTRSAYVLTAAETAPCTCPEACERDHGNE